MNEIFSFLSHFKKTNDKNKNNGNKVREELLILEEIEKTKEQINCDKNWLNTETDEDLIEVCIYELKALEARYRFLFRLAQNRRISIKFMQKISDEVRKR
ncbi:MAG: YaaL family protein [Oscillospiraceae bacterium]|jgi:hypothetical protein|nr:YaaL family protein [Oscillospiraceae bacterium]